MYSNFDADNAADYPLVIVNDFDITMGDTATLATTGTRIRHVHIEAARQRIGGAMMGSKNRKNAVSDLDTST